MDKQPGKKRHFNRRDAKKLQWPMDVLEMIATRGLRDSGRCILMLMQCNRDLCKRLMHAHVLWKELYLEWNLVRQPGYVKPVPNFHPLKAPDLIQPRTLDELQACFLILCFEMIISLQIKNRSKEYHKTGKASSTSSSGRS